MVVLAAAAGKLVGRRRFRWIRCVWGVSCRACRAAVVNKPRAGAAADRGDRPADSPVRATGPGAWRRATGISKSGARVVGCSDTFRSARGGAARVGFRRGLARRDAGWPPWKPVFRASHFVLHDPEAAFVHHCRVRQAGRIADRRPAGAVRAEVAVVARASGTQSKRQLERQLQFPRLRAESRGCHDTKGSRLNVVARRIENRSVGQVECLHAELPLSA